MSGFVDEAQVHLKAGDGGNGAVSFRREAHVSKGGPDGGHGGSGGNVWLVADGRRSSLASFRDHPFHRATPGTHGGGKKKTGADGQDCEVAVPPGTLVKALDGTLLADLAGAGDRWLGARGGKGGRGNANFLTNARRAPAFAEKGEPGEESWYNLELRLFADVAIVGFPNAGKSTLISAVSAAKPKIASYPFTTLVPHLGVVRRRVSLPEARDGSRRPGPGEEGEMVLADIPGLVEGAAEGRGLGHRFLRHVERARVLLILADLSASGDAGLPPPEEQVKVLLSELERFDPDLVSRPRVVVGSKVDACAGGPGGRSSASVGVGGIGGEAGGGAAASPVGTGSYGTPGSALMLPEPLELAVSAVTGEGITELMDRLFAVVLSAREEEDAKRRGGGFVLHRPSPGGVAVERAGDGLFVVRGEEPEHLVSSFDLDDENAAAYVADRLQRIGVDRALLRAGCAPGDSVRIGEAELVYVEGDESLATRRSARRAAGGS